MDSVLRNSASLPAIVPVRALFGTELQTQVPTELTGSHRFAAIFAKSGLFIHI